MSNEFNPFEDPNFVEETSENYSPDINVIEDYDYSDDLYDSDDESSSDITEFSDDEFAQVLDAGTYQRQVHLDANLPRYGIAVLNPIPMIDSTPHFYLGDFNLKNRDPRKGNLKNLDFFPRLTLFPFTTQPIPVPHEGTASLLSEKEAEKEKPAEFDVSSLEATMVNARRVIPRSAEQFANQVYDRYKKEGFVILHSLDGLGMAEATRLLHTVITVEKVNEAYPVSVRERFGFELEPPYLPEIIKYLENNGLLAEIKKAARNIAEAEKLSLLRRELIAACRIARSYCEKTLSQTEKLITDKHKDGYDLPNLDYKNAKPPLDLVAMIHLNRYPQSEKVLEVARATADSLANVGRNNAVPAQTVQSGVPADEVIKMLTTQRNEFEEKLDQLRKELIPEVPKTSVPVVPEAKQPTSTTTPTKKK